MTNARPRALLLAIALTALGCARTEGERLVIATAWPEDERTEIASAFLRWAEKVPDAAGVPIQIRWVALKPGDDLVRATRRLEPIDVVLGGPAADFIRLVRNDRLVVTELPGHPTWCVAARSPITLKPSLKGMAIPQPDSLTIDDPRHDPVALAWAKGRLNKSWAEGYAALVREANSPRRIGREPGSALAAIERNEADVTPMVPRSVLSPTPVVRRDFSPELIEGVAILKGGLSPSLAQLFVRFLTEQAGATAPPADLGIDPDVDQLIADLLGATLVDAQDELWTAWDALRWSGNSERAMRWMTEPPPWPPASVQKMIDAGDSDVLLETLARELSPDPKARAWLTRSWLSPKRLVDDKLLAELAGAVEGRLVHESRFRAWLRAEWTAWARQRYRRVAKLAGMAST